MKIGITLIATGFEHKDPFDKPQQKSEQPKKEERILLTLGLEAAPVPVAQAPVEAPLGTSMVAPAAAASPGAEGTSEAAAAPAPKGKKAKAGKAAAAARS